MRITNTNRYITKTQDEIFDSSHCCGSGSGNSSSTSCNRRSSSTSTSTSSSIGSSSSGSLGSTSSGILQIVVAVAVAESQSQWQERQQRLPSWRLPCRTLPPLNPKPMPRNISPLSSTTAKSRCVLRLPRPPGAKGLVFVLGFAVLAVNG